ncbi:sodium- and chloride-dependent GABA transporter 3-like [Antennarius striatus]|uniref:sodium- and chloride-dependent GABA transporter 3-like n=1 Tax=Antennarius striatus TaxID=241820 RepID=UPI0035AEAAAC
MFLLETVIGQYAQESSMTCWIKFCPLAQGVGYSLIMIQLIFRMYIIILAWALLYFINSFRDPLPWATCSNPWNTEQCVDITYANMTAIQSDNLTVKWTSGNLTMSSVSEFWEREVLSMSEGIEVIGTVQWELLLCQLICWMACYFCIWKGVRSTGKVVYVTALFPYLMLAILMVRGMTLPGAWQGVVYYLYPDLSRLTDLQVWLDACTQVLFSYGVVGGTLITLGSYNKVKNNCYKDSLWLCLLNSCTSFVAGFVVFSVLGFMAEKMGLPVDKVVKSGAGLAFIAFPQAVAMMPLPQLWAVCFFIMLLMLGLDTVFAGLETITASVIDMFPTQMRRPWRREIFLIIFCSAFFLIQTIFTSQGGIYLFQLIDYYAVNGAGVLFLCLIECVAVGWAFGAERMSDVVERMTGQRPCVLFKLCWRYITPLICMVIGCWRLSQLSGGVRQGTLRVPRQCITEAHTCLIFTFLNYEALTSTRGYVYPDWAYGLGWTMACFTAVPVPIWAVVKIWTTNGTFKERLLVLWYPARDPANSETNEDNLLNEPDIKTT